MLLGVIIYFFYLPLFLPFSFSYFLCWTLFLPELREKTMLHSYRFSALRLLFFILKNVEEIKQWESNRTPRVLLTVSLVLLFTFFVNIYFMAAFLSGILIFELWFHYFSFLHKFPQSVTAK